MLAHLGGDAPTLDEIAAYDRTVDWINHVIGVYNAQITSERAAKAPTSESVVDDLVERRARFIKARSELVPQNQEQVAALQAQCVSIIQIFGEGSRDDPRG